MIEFKLKAPPSPFDLPWEARQEAHVRLDVAREEEHARFQVDSPDPNLVEEVRTTLLSSYGHRGRFVEEETTGIDLIEAMAKGPMQKFEPERTK